MNIGKIVNEEKDKILNFGLEIAFWDVISRITRIKSIYSQKHKSILKYLKREYSDILLCYKNQEDVTGGIDDGCTIWIFWYQGFENAPEVVKACLSSLKNCAEKHPVVELDKNNITQYVDIPRYITEKVEAGIITITQFSDILRVSLLAKYGGCWADATLFFEKWFQDDLAKLTWYSIKQNPIEKDPRYVSDYKWSAFLQIAAKEALIANYMQAMFYEYWKKEKCMIDYFLVDYFFALGYQEVPAIKEAIDKVPKNNTNISWLGKHINEEYQDDIYKQILKDTVLFKLSWKTTYIGDKRSYLAYVIKGKE